MLQVGKDGVIHPVQRVKDYRIKKDESAKLPVTVQSTCAATDVYRKYTICKAPVLSGKPI